ncbi:hypothetical protein [Pseudomarimonas arenosa]|uniref:Uncharacterized protein n=1 Tax=Pseudomarimonas arenosa TaxID=2774145 RepID=A0AAW3ZK96_9GAMM|nr:hypothetical protein [Pseudomarimonas arenosa]MBD8526426.1 hypothetical protein [Pseudomarimonas arenosa]
MRLFLWISVLLIIATGIAHSWLGARYPLDLAGDFRPSVNGLAKGMNRMGRGYSFDVIRARMLYDPKARKAGAVEVIERVPDTDSGMMKVDASLLM